MITFEDYRACLHYIDHYWDKITNHQKQDEGVHIGLPNKFVSPNNDIYRGDQFYWDTYFTIVELLRAGRVYLAKGMVDNLIFLYKSDFYNKKSSPERVRAGPNTIALDSDIFSNDCGGKQHWRSQQQPSLDVVDMQRCYSKKHR